MVSRSENRFGQYGVVEDNSNTGLDFDKSIRRYSFQKTTTEEPANIKSPTQNNGRKSKQKNEETLIESNCREDEKSNVVHRKSKEEKLTYYFKKDVGLSNLFTSGFCYIMNTKHEFINIFSEMFTFAV